MRENFDNERRFTGSPAGAFDSLQAEDWSRLEEVGDLHFHAYSFSSALDYYGQLLDVRVLGRMPRAQALRVLQKGVDSWLLLGNLEVAEQLLDRADDVLIDHAADANPDETAVEAAKIRRRRALVLRDRGRMRDALELFKQAFSVLALTDEHADVARIQVGMGICHTRLGNIDKAEELFSDGMSTFRRIGHEPGLIGVMNNLSVLHKNRCNWSQALSLTEQAVDLARKTGTNHVLTSLYVNQGLVLLKTNRLGEARTALNKGLRIAQGLGERLQCTRLFLALGHTEMLDGRLARAEELLLEGQGMAARNGFRRETVIADEYLGDIQLLRGEIDKARFNYELGLEKNTEIAGGNDLEGELLRRMGAVHLRGGQWEEAVAVSQAALGVCTDSSEFYEVGFCHLTLGEAYGAMKDLRQSDHHFREAIATFSEQHLVHLWCEAIIRFSDSRLESAGEGELLLLRRYLMDAQADGASTVSDRMLCQVLQRLAQTQIRLGQFDDALLTVFELERHAAGFENPELDRQVIRLRNLIEAGFVGGVRLADSNLQALGSIPAFLREEVGDGPSNLGSVLDFGMERVAADSGFVALADSSEPGDELKIVARKGLTANLGHQLTYWFDSRKNRRERTATEFFSRLDPESDLVARVPALATVADSCVFMPIASGDEIFGLLFLGKSSGRTGSAGFDRASLDFLGAYMGFLALLLSEKNRRATELPAEAPERILNFETIITQNREMLDILRLARKVAPSDLTVLLNGETGTGKGLLAKSIHSLSQRADRKFLSINCAAIPETLLESELFGHVKGAFTGAHSDKKGLLAEAEGGTVFLDEVGKMSLPMQGKMLHFLDSRKVRPVGGNVEFEVDVRIVCASKMDLNAMSRKDLFLEDLFYRMVDFPLTIPPLNDRKDDIALLVRHFVGRFSSELGGEMPSLDSGFMDALMAYSWPGNVRELEKTLKRALILGQTDGVLRIEHLPASIGGAGREGSAKIDQAPLRETIAGVECREIEMALGNSGWNKSQAARALGISYPNLLKKIRHYGLKNQT